MLTQLLNAGSGGMVGDSVTAVRDLVRALNDAGVPASFDNTGGGCMAVCILFGPVIGSHGLRQYEILITDEDTFSLADYDSDECVSGFNAGLYVYGPDGERVSMRDDSVLIYRTAEDAGGAPCWVPNDPTEPFKLVDLAGEMKACLKAVTGVVTLVRNATLIARSGERLSW